MLKCIMDHLVAADVLLGDQAALPLSGGKYSNMANNVFYFASRVVDKLWQGKQPTLQLFGYMVICVHTFQVLNCRHFEICQIMFSYLKIHTMV